MARKPAHRIRALALSIFVLAAMAGTAPAAPVRGTAGDDRLSGTARPDTIRGGAGDDVLRGRGAGDLLAAGRGDDRASGMAGNDRIHGDAGDDELAGDGGRDVISGGTGADTLTGGAGADRLAGGPGRDLIRARNHGRDRVDCGPGRDTAILDSRDVAVRCEVIRRPRPASPANASPTPALTQPPAAPKPDAAVPAATGDGTIADPDPPADPPADPPVDPPVDPPLPPDDFPQLLAAGDIADCTPPAEQTATLLDDLRGTVAPLGDTAYPSGSYEDFANCYEPTWGRYKDRTRPAVGSHEYDTPGAVPYWDYFGAAAGETGKGWYSYNLGSWHIVVLNSACAEVGGCGEGSEQLAWLRADLAANPSRCTAAYWHAPRYSSGKRHGSDPGYIPFWQVLYEYGAELVLGANDHHYERFAPQNPYGDPDPTDGIRQFVVGTGGRFLRETSNPPRANSEAVNDDTHGVLRVGLLETGYEWEFVPVAGATYTDSGSDACR